MDLGPAQPVVECPTCGVDAARAMVVSACVAFYKPVFACPQCDVRFRSLQEAANHAAGHNPDLLAYVQHWLDTYPITYRLVRED